MLTISHCYCRVINRVKMNKIELYITIPVKNKSFVPLFLLSISSVHGVKRSFLIKLIDLDQYRQSHYMIGAMDLSHTHFESYSPEDY